MNHKPITVAAVAAILVAAGASYYFWRTPAANSQFHGWVEADLLFMGADEPGRLTTLSVAEGQAVQAGAPLFQLQSDIQEAELHQARAALTEAKARLAQAETARQRPEEIAVLRAQEARAQAALEQSEPELERTRKLVERQIAAPARLDQAKAAFERDKAQLMEIRRQIEVAGLKARPEDIEAAQGVVRQAEARLASAKIRLAQRNVLAPVAGVIQEIYFRTGEIVQTGRPVLSLLPPGNLKLRFFVPQPELPHIALGDTVRVHCDGCSAAIDAEVTFLARQAEFTPPVIFSSEERAKLVFKVEAVPKRPELLRVGQPVSVSLLSARPAETAYGSK